MRITQARKLIRLARTRAEREIAGNARSGGRFAAALSSEGYQGGYRDALDDVLLLISDVVPRRRDYWDDLLSKKEG